MAAGDGKPAELQSTVRNMCGDVCSWDLGDISENKADIFWAVWRAKVRVLSTGMNTMEQ